MIGLDALLLFPLALKFVALFQSRSSVYQFATEERFLVFPIITLIVLGIYLGVSLGRRTTTNANTRLILVGLLGVFLVGSLLAIQIAVRQQTRPYLFIHDGAVQTEDAIAALRHGQNPYAIDYSHRTFGAFVDGFSEATRPNPAWTHYVYLPMQFVAGVPFAASSDRLFGWFDVRLMYALSFVIMSMAVLRLCQSRERKILATIFLFFNPIFAGFFVSGFNDVFFLGWIALGALLLQRQKTLWAGFAFGAAFASKQSAWFLIPFYLGYLAFRASPGKRWQAVARQAWPALLVAVAVLAPFIVWSPPDFFDDIWQYPSGAAALSYPISGMGLSQLLLSAGVIHSMWDYYPFWIIQAVVGIPLMVILLRWLKSKLTVSRMIAAYGIFSLALIFISRYFNDSHLGALSVIFLISFAADHQHDHDARLESPAMDVSQST